MLRANRFAAAIDMMAAGTSAPMTIAEYPIPANQLGNMCSNNSGTDSCALPPPALTPAFTAGGARAHYPNNPIRPSTNQKGGRGAPLRPITPPPLSPPPPPTPPPHHNHPPPQPPP